MTALHPTALSLPAADCADWLRSTLAWKPGEHREIRVICPSQLQQAVVSSPEQAAEAIKDVAYGKAAYITMNPIGSGAAAIRSIGSTLISARKGRSACDSDIERRTLFVIDLDPERPTDTSATEEQLAESRALARTIIESLHAEGWPKPTEVCSGNGMHLYYRIDLDGGSDLPARALKGLAGRFSTAAVKVDTTVGNASRIMRMPGTWTAKGADRSLHRICTQEAVGEDIQLTRDQLEAVAVPASVQPTPPANSPPSTNDRSFDVDAWLQRHGVRHRGKEPWPGGGAGACRWVLGACAFDPAHNRGEAVVTQQASGAIGFTCHHDSCAEHGWKEFRRVIEAAAQAKNSPTPTETRPRYPVDALPPTIRDVVRAQVDVMPVDEAAIAVPLITALLAVVGNAVRVEPWDGWSEAMSAWTALVAPSGGMKSATIGFAEKALQKLQAGFAKPLPKEKPERLVVRDATVEALGDIASRNPRGLIVVRDELAGFLQGIGQYKRASGADEGFWLSAYEGAPHDVDRRSTGSSTVPRLLVSVIGGIQPSVLRQAMSERNRWQSGFAARYWFVLPPRDYIPIKQPAASLSLRLTEASTRLSLCLESLRKIPMTDGHPTILRLEQHAIDLLEPYADKQHQIAHGLPAGSVQEACRDKSRGWVAKVAGLIALLRAYESLEPTQDGSPAIPDYQGVTVQGPDVEAAIRLIDWQLSENLRMYRGLGLDDLDRELQRKHELAAEALDPSAGTATVRDYTRKHGVGQAEAEQALKALVKAGLWGERHPKPGPHGGRPTVLYFPLGAPALI